MLVNDLLAAINKLDSEDLERLKEHLAQQDDTAQPHPPPPADLDAAIDEFWGDSSQEEMQIIFEAMCT